MIFHFKNSTENYNNKFIIKNCTREKFWKCDFPLAITSIVPLEESLILLRFFKISFSFFLSFSFWDLFCKEISNSTFSIIFLLQKVGGWNWKLQWWKSGKVPVNSWIGKLFFLSLEVKLKSLQSFFFLQLNLLLL